jgi:leukotriene-A4 hydrolase
LATLGFKSLEDSINEFNKLKLEKFTSLYISHKEIDPDDAFSSVPYEKGFYFLFYLAKLVGGHKNFEEFLKNYFINFKFKCVNRFDFKKYFEEYFKNNENLKKIEWDKWYL